MTWDNATSSAEMHHCLFVQKGDNTCTMQNVYRIPINATGENLNHLTCDDYNRQRTYCSQCTEGYGMLFLYIIIISNWHMYNNNKLLCAEIVTSKHLKFVYVL